MDATRAAGSLAPAAMSLPARPDPTAIGPDALSREGTQRQVLVAQVDTLYKNAVATSLGAFVAGVVCWVLFYLHTGDPAVLVWAMLLHATQAVRFGLLRSYRRRQGQAVAAEVWLKRYLWALFLAGLGWGLAPVLFMPADDLAYAAFLMLILLGMGVGAISAVAPYRTAVTVWLLPLLLPLIGVLLWRGDLVSIGLAVFTVAFLGVNLRFGLGQNELLTRSLQAQFDNAALVERLRHQIELTAQANRDKSRFLAAASHDLRQPMHALGLFGAALERRMADSPERPIIRNMMRSIEALERSFGAMLDISKLDAGVIEPNIQPFALRDLFRRLHMNFAGQADEAGLGLRLKPGGRVVTSDPYLLERILGNLIQNGLRYTRKGGVAVLARDWQGGVNIEVWDTGVGIPAGELNRVFDEFYQIGNAERDRAKGLGMGLAIVKRLVHLLGHRLTVRSRVGQGTLFRIWIPRAEFGHGDAVGVAADTIPGGLTECRTVLFIDDEETIRLSVSNLLSEWGYHVVACATIREACAIARDRNGRIDLLVSDLRLRDGEDGVKAIAAVRKICGHAMPAVLVTGDTSPDQVRRAHESGHVVLFKPVQPKELLTVLKRLA